MTPNEPREGRALAPLSDVPPQGGYFAKSCERKVWNDLDAAISDELQDPFSEAVLHRMEEGNRFEDEIEADLKAAILSADPDRPSGEHADLAAHEAVGEVRWHADGTLAAVFFVGDRTLASKKAREQATTAAMKLGVPLLWNPRLPADLAGRRIGEPDFLVRYGDQPKADGVWAYVPGDVKHHKALDGQAKPRRWPAATLDDLTVSGLADHDLGKGTPRKDDAYQLAFYTRMLEAHGHGLPDQVRRVGLLIGKEKLALLHDLQAPTLRARTADGGSTAVSPLEAFDDDWDTRMRIARAAVVSTPERPAIPVVDAAKRTACAECVWATVCHTQRLVDDHVSRVVGVSQTQAAIHADLGTTTVADLSRLDVATAMCVDAGMDVPALIRAGAAAPDRSASGLLSSSGLADDLASVGITDGAGLSGLCPVTASYSGTRIRRLVEQIDRARVMVVGTPHLARGVSHVSIPRSSIEHHVDIEDNNGFVYLIGVKAFGKKSRSGKREKRRSEYEAFVTWDTTPEAEADVLARWWQYEVGHKAYARSNRWGLNGYCYTHHERSTLLKKAAEHAGRPGVPTVEELKEFFEADTWVDLHKIVQSDVLLPCEDVKLKTVATKVAGFAWRDTDPSGGNSMAWYATAVDPDVDPDERAAAQQRLLEYNEDDCHATYAIAEWFSLHGVARRPGASLPQVEDLEPQFRRLRRDPGPAHESVAA